ncbi:MAG: hypothetical protein HYS80_01110 [Candidatus Aenigmarchaeota archaeon]|nr:hypothetical protein [Candidatus Aenigmarchaeota archaeon]
MKGQIAIIEAIMSAVALFIAFNMMITVEEHQTKWKDALSFLQGKDILITADRLGQLHEYPFSPAFQTQFLSKIDAIRDAIVKNETQGTLENTVYIACVCMPDQITYLQNILDDVKFNTRIIKGEVCPTILPDINNCGAETKYPNALVIWGYKDYLPSYAIQLNDFLNDGNSIIEIADIQQSQVDSAQQTIFGLQWFTNNPFPSITQDEFLKPRNASVIPYQSYKWFYHLPYLLTGTATISIPLDAGGSICTSPSVATAGNFKFQNTDHKFWICDGNSVYFDTDGTDKADVGPISKGQRFSIGSSDFKLNYIDAVDKMRLSFRQDYKFDDFVKDNGDNKLFPIDNDKNKVLLSMGFWDVGREQPAGAVIFSGTENAKTVWMADFARSAATLNDLDNLGDDYKQLLVSLMFSTANKNPEDTSQQIGQITSYINVNNTDIFEIYRIDLSIGAPF